MNKKILILSATSNNNLNLSGEISRCIDDASVEVEILNLEEHALPLFTEDYFNNNKNKFSSTVEFITDKFVESDGLIVCAPEYNGSIPPIVNNTIAWISMSTKYWRDAFSNKIGLVCTHSGGDGSKFIIAMKLQLEHLGVIVFPRNISVSESKKFNNESCLKVLKQFIKLL